MPETAPLDVSEAAVGYELDSITLRNIASVRYVRHHEWLDHVLGNPLAISNIIPPKLMDHVDTSNMEERIKQLDAEIAELEAEKEKGWKLHLDETKAQELTQAIRKLRKEFGSSSYEETKDAIENLLGVKIEESNVLRKAPITYDRKKVDEEQAAKAIEKAKEEAAEAAKAKSLEAQNAASSARQASSGASPSNETSLSKVEAPVPGPGPSVPDTTSVAPAPAQPAESKPAGLTAEKSNDAQPTPVPSSTVSPLTHPKTIPDVSSAAVGQDSGLDSTSNVPATNTAAPSLGPLSAPTVQAAAKLSEDAMDVDMP